MARTRTRAQHRALAREVVPRPAAGVDIDPAWLMWYRDAAPLSRQGLADAVSALGWTGDDGYPLRTTRDSIAKYEHADPAKRHRVRHDRLAAICEVLGIMPVQLFPGQGPPPEMSPTARYRMAREQYNTELRAFADGIGRPELYRNENGRMYYAAELYRLYDAETGALAEPAAP